MKNKFKLKKYDSLDECVLASWKYEDPFLTDEEIKESTITCFDANGKEIEITYRQQAEAMKSQGVWGWIDLQFVIHFWWNGKVPFNELIHFFAHEIGHRVGVAEKDDLKEELRAETYGYTASLAFQFCNELI